MSEPLGITAILQPAADALRAVGDLSAQTQVIALHGALLGLVHAAKDVAGMTSGAPGQRHADSLREALALFKEGRV